MWLKRGPLAESLPRLNSIPYALSVNYILQKLSLRYSGDDTASNYTFTAKEPKEVIEHENFGEWEEKMEGSQLTRIEAAKTTIKSKGLVTNAKKSEKENS